MSSVSSNHSSHFSPPQSAQPYTSLFGGPISQDVADLEPYNETQQSTGYEDEDDLDVAMDDGSLIENDLSDDDEDYIESDEEGSGSDNNASNPNATYRPSTKTNVAVTSTAGRKPEESPPSSPVYRPNRFRGPESTWRKLTVEDRQNAQALEAIRAKDLAAHLYNAYALRVRAREIARQAVENDAQDTAEAFLPPKRWTAWPMSATEVPRAGEYLRREEDDAWTLRMQPDPRPSAELEESIMAIMLKTAKDRFEARDWASRAPALRQRRGLTSQPGTNDESTAVDGDWASDNNSNDEVELRPVVQADDDKSRRQLRPLTRNIITQFDNLLTSLHHARKGGVAVDDSSASEWQSDTESVASGASSSRSRKRRIKEKTERSQSRGRKRTRRSSVRAGSAGGRSRSVYASSGPASSRSRGRSVGSSSKRSISRIRLGLRDWSEVLGVASMIGWPASVVMRSAQRCAALFGENMAFQTFKEGKLQQHTEEGKLNTWEYSESESDEPEPEPSPPPRSQSRRSRQSRSRVASTKARGSVSRPVSPTSDNTGEGLRPKGKGQHRKQDLVCPIKSCRRHVNGFTRTWNLNLHMKRMHPGYRSRSIDGKSPAPSVRTEISNDDE